MLFITLYTFYSICNTRIFDKIVCKIIDQSATNASLIVSLKKQTIAVNETKKSFLSIILDNVSEDSLCGKVFAIFYLLKLILTNVTPIKLLRTYNPSY